MDRHVFISHASENKERIRPVLEALLEKGLTLWLDNPRALGLHSNPNVRRIRSYESWEASIRQGVEKAAAVIVFWSAAASSEGRDELHEEARTAKRQRLLIQVAIEPLFKLGTRLPWGFSERQILDLSDELDAFHAGRSPRLDIGDLLEDVMHLVNREHKPDESPHASAPAVPRSLPPPSFGPGSSPGAAGTMTPAHASAEDPLPYFLDRVPQQNDFIAALCEELKGGPGARPCVFLLPGPREERADKFIDLLEHVVIEELCHEGNLGRQFDWATRRLHWPCCGAELTRDIRERHLPYCLSALGTALAVGGAGLARSDHQGFARHVANGLQSETRGCMLIHTRIEAGTAWSSLDEELIKAYLAWWQTVPMSDIRTRPILLLSLVGSAERPRAFAFMRRQASVYSFVDALDPVLFPGLKLVSLQRLESIAQRHVVTWAETVFDRKRAARVAHAASVKEACRYVLKDNEMRPLDWVGKQLGMILLRPEVAAQYMRDEGASS